MASQQRLSHASVQYRCQLFKKNTHIYPIHNISNTKIYYLRHITKHIFLFMNTINTYFWQHFLNHIIHIILNNVTQTPLPNGPNAFPLKLQDKSILQNYLRSYIGKNLWRVFLRLTVKWLWVVEWLILLIKTGVSNSQVFSSSCRGLDHLFFNPRN